MPGYISTSIPKDIPGTLFKICSGKFQVNPAVNLTQDNVRRLFNFYETLESNSCLLRIPTKNIERLHG